MPQPHPGSIICGDLFSVCEFDIAVLIIYSAIYCGVKTIPFSFIFSCSNKDSKNSIIFSNSVEKFEFSRIIAISSVCSL